MEKKYTSKEKKTKKKYVSPKIEVVKMSDTYKLSLTQLTDYGSGSSSPGPGG